MPHTTRPEEHAVRRLVDRVWNALDAAAAHELVAPECPGLGGTGPEAVLDWHADRRAAFPDLRYVVDDLVASSGHAAIRWTATGTQRGEYGPIPPTGRSATWAGATFATFDATGRIADVWSVNDLFGLVQQLGARVEAPGPDGA
jgi:predicted ester cyclase